MIGGCLLDGPGLTDPALVGYKFARQAVLRAAGYPVPEFVCVPVTAFDQMLATARPDLPKTSTMVSATPDELVDWSARARAAVTVAVTQLLTRALDDVRDLDYDRLHHPRRPVVTGAVRPADLVVLLAVGLAAMLALNAPRGTPALGYAAAAGYLLILLAVDLRWRWPPGDRLLPQLATGLPALLLISGYVYAGFLHRYELAPTGLGLAVLAAVTVGVLHLEFARRITRAPAPGQRTYVYEIGVSGTVAAALVCAGAATGWALVVTRPWSGGGYGWGWLVLLALGFTATGAWRFLRGATRWPVGPAAFYVLASFATATVAGLLGAA